MAWSWVGHRSAWAYTCGELSLNGRWGTTSTCHHGEHHSALFFCSNTSVLCLRLVLTVNLASVPRVHWLRGREHEQSSLMAREEESPKWIAKQSLISPGAQIRGSFRSMSLHAFSIPAARVFLFHIFGFCEWAQQVPGSRYIGGSGLKRTQPGLDRKKFSSGSVILGLQLLVYGRMLEIVASLKMVILRTLAGWVGVDEDLCHTSLPPFLQVSLILHCSLMAIGLVHAFFF